MALYGWGLLLFGVDVVIDPFEFDAAGGEVCIDDAHAEGIADFDLPVGEVAVGLMLVFAEYEIVGQGIEGDEAFDEGVGENGEDAAFDESGDLGVEHFADVVADVFDLEVAYGFAFCFEGGSFALRDVGADALEFFGVDGLAAFEFFEDAVDDQVGVASDGRGKVGVVIEAETEVADVLGVVFCFCHGAYGEGAEESVFFVGFGDLGELVEGVDDLFGCVEF